MYSTSFGLLGVQFILGDVFGITMRNIEGAEIKSNLLEVIRLGDLNAITANIVSGDFASTGENTTDFNRVENSLTAAAFVAWELVQLMSGTYIFNLLLLLGIPSAIIAGPVIIYIFLLGRAIMGYIRGI